MNAGRGVQSKDCLFGHTPTSYAAIAQGGNWSRMKTRFGGAQFARSAHFEGI